MKSTNSPSLKIETSVGFPLESYFTECKNVQDKKTASSALIGRLARRSGRSKEELVVIREANVIKKSATVYECDEQGIQTNSNPWDVPFNSLILLPETEEEFNLAINGYQALIKKAEKARDFAKQTGLSPYNISAKKYWVELEEKMGNILPKEARLLLVKLSAGNLKSEDIPEHFASNLKTYLDGKLMPKQLDSQIHEKNLLEPLESSSDISENMAEKLTVEETVTSEAMP